MGIAPSNGATTLTNSTVSGNSTAGYAADGGGIAVFDQLTISNSIVLGNTTSSAGFDEIFESAFRVGDGTPAFLGGNIVGADSSAFNISGLSNVVNADPAQVFAATTGNSADGTVLAGILADNGGPVQTIALLDDIANPAIDVSNGNFGSIFFLTDVNGAPRFVDNPNVDNGGFIDAGAVELQTGAAVMPDAFGLVVTTTDDVIDLFDGETSLREAIALANTNPDADIISFDASIFTGGENNIITLTQGELEITSALTIDGDLNDDTIADIIISGDIAGDDDRQTDNINTDFDESLLSTTNIDRSSRNPTSENSRVLNIKSGDVIIDGIAITGGYASNDFNRLRSNYTADITLEAATGGGVRVAVEDPDSAQSIIFVNSIISGNRSIGEGGGIFIESGNVEVNNSQLTNNTVGSEVLEASRGSGTVNAPDAANGGGVSILSGTLSLYATYVAENEAGNGFITGRISTYNPPDSSEGGNGGGVYVHGGANAEIINSTFANNRAGDSANAFAGENGTPPGSSGRPGQSGGDGGNGGGIALAAGASATIANTTFIGNQAGDGADGKDGGNGSSNLFGGAGRGGNGGDGGDAGRGGAIYLASGQTTLNANNLTITGNTNGTAGTSGSGGSGSSAQFTDQFGNLMVNTAPGGDDGINGQSFAGSGIYNAGTTNSISLNNSLILANSNGDIGGAGINTISNTSNLIGANPLATFVDFTPFEDGFTGVLADNGGLVPTIALLSGGLADNIGDPSLLPADIFDLDGDGDITEPLPLDANGLLRLTNGSLDLGATQALNNITQNGSPEADSLEGSDADDIITSLAGNDTLSGLGGNDILNGGADADIIFGNDGADILIGASENDSLLGGDGNDTISGGDGDDALAGNDGNDSIFGNNGDDRLFGENGSDLLEGRAGNDTLNGGGNNDLLLGGTGRDILNGQFGNDFLEGGIGLDRLFGGIGDDTLEGGDQADFLSGGNGNDSINGEAGNDRLFGGRDDDILDGGDDNDLITGGFGRDTLLGSSGNDTLLGNSGFDVLNGGNGDDVLTGGFNADIFVLSYVFGDDIITDFDQANNFERIDLTSVSNITDFDDLVNNHLSEDEDGNAVIDASIRGNLTLLGVDMNDLNAGDFIF